MKNSQVPVARKDGLVVQEMPEEVLVYDLKNNKAHCLNRTAASVWKYSDGHNSVTDIAKLLETEAGSKIDEDLIWLAVDQLEKNGLLLSGRVTLSARQNRREVLKKIGLASAVALPIVASLAVPNSVYATSSCTPSGVCTPASLPCCIGGIPCPGTGVCP